MMDIVETVGTTLLRKRCPDCGLLFDVYTAGCPRCAAALFGARPSEVGKQVKAARARHDGR